MLTAIHNSQTLYANHQSSDFLRKCSDEKSLFCRDCGEALLFKEYQDKQSHFSHYHSDCPYPFREPESLEHESGKLKIYEWLCTQFPKEKPSIEQKINETNQRSDTFVHSIHTAFEFQCSPIRAKTWEHRCVLYESAKVENIWILGYSMHKYHQQNIFLHKLNDLEKAILEKYGKIYYFDVLTNQFVFLYPEQEQKQGLLGKEYFFKPEEVMYKEGLLTSRYDGFLFYQKKRKEYLAKKVVQAKETDRFIKQIKKQIDAEKVLATKKQIKYIQFLLRKNQKTVPYKLHGILKEEATQLITELEKTAD